MFDVSSCAAAHTALLLLSWGSGGAGHTLSASFSLLVLPVLTGAASRVWSIRHFVVELVVLGQGWSGGGEAGGRMTVSIPSGKTWRRQALLVLLRRWPEATLMTIRWKMTLIPDLGVPQRVALTGKGAQEERVCLV